MSKIFKSYMDDIITNIKKLFSATDAKMVSQKILDKRIEKIYLERIKKEAKKGRNTCNFYVDYCYDIKYIINKLKELNYQCECPDLYKYCYSKEIKVTW